jgi:hypothetical protein
MGRALQRTVFFAGGLLIGCIAAVLVWKFYPGDWHASPQAALDRATERREALAARAASAQQASVRTQAPVALAPPVAPAACEWSPTLPPAGDKDGRFTVDAALSLPSTSSPGAFLDVAREAMGDGRPRDAEVALIVACRLAARQSTRPTVLLGDIQALLGEHYAKTKAADGAPDERTRRLFSDSLASYVAALGPQAAKTRSAQARLASADRAEPQATAVSARESPPSPPPVPAAAPALVHSDPDLAQLESDLARLRAQAESVSKDPAALRRQAERARAQRDAACHDRACLERWYAQRRRELLEEF